MFAKLRNFFNRFRTPPTPATTGGPRIMSILELSTQHLPQHVCQNLNRYDGISALDTGYGWMLLVPSDLADHRVDYAGSLPHQVWPLWEYARRYGADFIQLDRDTDTVGALPTGQW